MRRQVWRRLRRLHWRALTPKVRGAAAARGAALGVVRRCRRRMPTRRSQISIEAAELAAAAAAAAAAAHKKCISNSPSSCRDEAASLAAAAAAALAGAESAVGSVRGGAALQNSALMNRRRLARLLHGEAATLPLAVEVPQLPMPAASRATTAVGVRRQAWRRLH